MTTWVEQANEERKKTRRVLNEALIQRKDF